MRALVALRGATQVAAYRIGKQGFRIASKCFAMARRAAEVRGEADQAVEDLLGRGVEDAGFMERGQPGGPRGVAKEFRVHERRG